MLVVKGGDFVDVQSSRIAIRNISKCRTHTTLFTGSAAADVRRLSPRRKESTHSVIESSESAVPADEFIPERRIFKSSSAENGLVNSIGLGHLHLQSDAILL
jgi:hypothetical protein